MTIDNASLINLLGFVTGGALYAMLLAMVLERRGFSYSLRSEPGTISPTVDRLPFITAILGLCWNTSGILVNSLPTVIEDILNRGSRALLIATAFTALGYLPAVVVHSVLRPDGLTKQRKSKLVIVLIAYSLSTVASIMHFYSALIFKIAPSHIALHLLTYGFGSLILVLLVSTRGQANWRAGWIVALAGFAISAVHLSHHDGKNYAWWLELVGHQASLPLVLAILYQDFKFALADIFLKRAFSLLLLVSIVGVIYATVIESSSPLHLTAGESNPRSTGVLLTLWVGTALLYPQLRRGVDWFVDSIVLRRIDYVKLRADLVNIINDQDDQNVVLDAVCKELASALTAQEVRWTSSEVEDNPERAGNRSKSFFSLTKRFDHTGQLVLKRNLSDGNGYTSDLIGRDTAASFQSGMTTAVYIPTAEPPYFFLIVGELRGGRHLLSDDIAMLESVALLVARRIDALRVNHERCERTMHEQEISKLATEAELRALRAQLNPHFLFNALTTISYLIQSSPKRAQNTLMRLTGLLRGVLRRSAGEFTTLGEEIDLIEDYLEIEQARFEERLEVRIDAPTDFRALRVPSLILQPLVENAIKHGISPTKSGGSVLVTFRLIEREPDQTDELSDGPLESQVLKIAVHDTGAGVTQRDLSERRLRGLGLNNIEKRLRCHYGEKASLIISCVPGSGTISEISLPVALPF